MSALYDRIGRSYVATREEDPRIAAVIHAELGDARTVLNVGAGACAYEPHDREVTAVEPFAVMRAQRPPGAAPCIDARAEALPFADGEFDATMAVLSDHHREDAATRSCSSATRSTSATACSWRTDVQAARTRIRGRALLT